MIINFTYVSRRGPKVATIDAVQRDLCKVTLPSQKHGGNQYFYLQGVRIRLEVNRIQIDAICVRHTDDNGANKTFAGLGTTIIITADSFEIKALHHSDSYKLDPSRPPFIDLKRQVAEWSCMPPPGTRGLIPEDRDRRKLFTHGKIPQ